MSKVSKDFILCTFSIIMVCWGVYMVFRYNGISLNDNSALYILYLLGGWSPTIASYVVLKKNKQIESFKGWVISIFDFKHNALSYLLVIGFSVLFILPQCLIAGYDNSTPFFAIIVMLPMMFLMGGLEETGWRYILQPDLEEKHSFVTSTVIVSLIWWLWHYPLFYMQDSLQGNNYFAFGIKVFGLSFALACIRKCTKSAWLCVLLHCIVNSLLGIYKIRENILGNLVTTAILIAVSLITITINEKKKIFD